MAHRKIIFVKVPAEGGIVECNARDPLACECEQLDSAEHPCRARRKHCACGGRATRAVVGRGRAG